MDENGPYNLINLGEGQNIEFKQSVSNDIGKEMCAFANSNGGTILIGVTDRGEITPLSSLNKVVSQVQNHARNCDPAIGISVEVVSGVIVIIVPESNKKPHSSKGVFYLREGANSQRMNREQILEFFYKEGHIYFDSQVNPAFEVDNDLEGERYSVFAQEAGIPKEMRMLEALRNLHLLKDNGMTNAGVLLLCKESTPFLVSATVTCALFQGSTGTKILDTKIFNGDVATNFKESLMYLQSRLNTEYIITSKRENVLELPEVALRESVVNALCHRDYRSRADVQIQIFSDRVVIVNPGGLVGGLRIENLGTRSIPRNPLLFGNLYRMKMVEHVGSGIRRIRESMRSYGLDEPIIEADENWFSLTFLRKISYSGDVSEKASEKASEKTSEKILTMIRANNHITIEELADSIGVTQRSIERNIKKLREADKLRRVGPDKGGYWEVPE